MLMTFGSVCSGIEAASVAFGPLGWKAAWLAEIEPFPCAVLAHHYPDVPNLGDMTTIRDRLEAGEVEAPDVLCGGTPCQSFSVAGLRKSMSDERGNLSFEFIRIANANDHLRHAAGRPPAWILWENVLGVLSTSDNAFGSFLGGLAGCESALDEPQDGWPGAGVVAGPQRVVAWRTLDAQHFGVAQRRRRVFVLALAGPGRWACADALLPVGDRMLWHPAPSRGKGQDPAAGTLRSTDGGSDVDHARANHIVSTIDASFGRLQGASGQDANHGQSHLIAYGGNRTSGPIEVTPALLAQPGSGWKGDFESETFITHSLRGEGFDASEDGTGRGTPLVPVATFQSATEFLPQSSRVYSYSEVAPTLQATGARNGNRAPQVAIAFHGSQDPDVSGDVTHPVGRNQGRETCAQIGMMVRRLTPVECERLMGFPDDYTAIPWCGKPADQCQDGPRYKALGNSWAVPVVSWIGEQIAKEAAC